MGRGVFEEKRTNLWLIQHFHWATAPKSATRLVPPALTDVTLFCRELVVCEGEADAHDS